MLHDTKKNRIYKNILFVYLICILMLNSFVYFGFNIIGNSKAPINISNPPPNGDWVINSIGNLISNKTITLNGSLIIKNGGSLVLRNVTLLMNCPVNGTYGIIIENGGSISILDYDDNSSTIFDRSNITSAIPDGTHRYYFYAKPGADFRMKNSELHECGYFGGDGPTEYWTRAPTIECSDALIENCIFTNNNYGLYVWFYANNFSIINSIISHSLYSGIIIKGFSLEEPLNNILIKDCIISSNGVKTDGEKGCIISSVNKLNMENTKIYHHPNSALVISYLLNSTISKCYYINNRYGIVDHGGHSNLNFSNNTLIGNLEYAIFSYQNTPLNAQFNYFGTNNSDTIRSQIYGNKINFSNYLKNIHSNIYHINNSKIWKNKIININNGLIINGNLSCENTTMILNNNEGMNFIQVNGEFHINNSYITHNDSNKNFISLFGFYPIKFTSSSLVNIQNSIIVGQKGICIFNNKTNIFNLSINGKREWYQKWGLNIINGEHIIRQCQFSDLLYGIELNSKNNTVIDSQFFNNWAGIKINSDLNLINNNIFEYNDLDGIHLGGSNNTLFNNTIYQNQNGITINSGHLNCISKSNISNNLFNGVYILGGSNGTISNCTFYKNDWEGIRFERTVMGEPARNFKIYHNNLIGNGINNSSTGNAHDKGYDNQWDNGYPSGGNYWDDYDGIDVFSGKNQTIIGSDGIGDTPYIIKGKSYYKSKDNYPLLYPVGEKYYILSPYLDQPNSPDPDGNYTLSWTSVLNATNYTVYEEHKGKTNTIELGAITNFEVIGKPNGTYQYYVQAKNDKVVSGKSNTIKVVVDYPPDIPSGLNAIPLSEGNTLEIKWLLNEVDTINYSLWSNHTGIWKDLENITHPLNQFVHNGLIDDEKYYYKIQAWDGINQSSKFSKIILGIPNDTVPPIAPTGLKASTISNSSIELTWEQNNESDLAGYDLYRTSDLDLNFTQINIVPILNNTYLDTGLNGNTTYYYKLLAYDEVPNYSGFSNIALNTTYLTSPRIISYSPKGVDVPLDSKIEIVFTKPMSKASVKQGLKINPIIDGNIFWDNDQQTMIFQPENDLLQNTNYNVTLVNPILDLEGGMLVRTFSWEFRTIELPKIIQYFPLGDFVNTDAIITITFNRDMNKTSVQEVFSIEPEVNGTFDWINDRKLIFQPDNKLPELTTFEIIIDYLAQDLIGNIIGEDFSWSFRTGDFTVPDIISYSPTDDGVAVDTQVSIVFSEPMNKSRVEASFTISPDIDGEFQWRGNTLVFIPDKDLKYDTKYTITLSSDAADKWGNPLADDLSWEFTTEKSMSDDGQSQGYDMVVISGIITIVIILIVIIISVIFRKRRESSKRDVTQQQDETLEE